MGASTSHNTTGLHGLLQFYLFNHLEVEENCASLVPQVPGAVVFLFFLVFIASSVRGSCMKTAHDRETGREDPRRGLQAQGRAQQCVLGLVVPSLGFSYNTVRVYNKLL
jgi:hypothetical protein